ncbi:MAG: hypothetical protein WA418_30580 [Bradyrhizobium sp.]
MMLSFCLRCDGTGWVCESHPDRPWEGSARACACGAPGEPCPVCNCADEETVPRLPEGLEADVVRDLDTDPLDMDTEDREDIEAAPPRKAN